MSKVKKCPGKDTFLRMNYLYQISHEALKNNQKVASNLYASLLIGISKKSVQKIEPEIKRFICKRCHQNLVPGITCKVKIKSKFINYACSLCKYKKSYKATKNYKLWCEKPEALVETLDYNTEVAN